VPTAPVTVAVSLADKLDSIAQFFSIKELPSGSRDPYALRRAALGLISLITANDLRIQLAGTGHWAVLLRQQQQAVEGDPASGPPPEVITDWTETQAEQWRGVQLHFNGDPNYVFDELPKFVSDRLKVQQREAGVRHDLIDAVFALGGEDDLVRLLARVHALQAFIGTADGTNLLAGYKRAANILKKEGFETSVTPAQAGAQTAENEAPHSGTSGAGLGPGLRRDDESADNPLSYTPEPAEKALMDALSTAGPQAAAAVQAEDFAGAMAALAILRAPIDAFFDSVTVNDPETDKRTARLSLLARFRDAVHGVADFSKIEG
ncbi:MAG: glycine--tRNA ligase subunit beta, partial [Pseudomonadota bacterium]|nr:glycine--tRNA ligase subunit beta [Pseudomonadota bacterium]